MMIKKGKTKVEAVPKKKVPKVDIIDGPNFRALYASGVFGGLDPNDGRMIFFLDRLKPKMKKGTKTVMELDKVERELQVEVHMSPAQFVSVAKWMTEHAQKFGKKMKTRGKKASETGTSYIG